MLTVVTFAQYLTETVSKMRGVDYDAQDFVKAIKGRAPAGQSTIPTPSGPKTLSNDNAKEAVGWFGEMAAVEINNRWKYPTIGLVPMPHSGCTTDSPTPGAPHKIVDSIHTHMANRTTCVDILRWTTAQQKAHEGGSRKPGLLYQSLSTLRSPNNGHPLILVDDVCTSGGHFQAAEAALRLIGMRVIGCLAVGRTSHEQEDDPFEVRKLEYDTWTPEKP